MALTRTGMFLVNTSRSDPWGNGGGFCLEGERWLRVRAWLRGFTLGRRACFPGPAGSRKDLGVLFLLKDENLFSGCTAGIMLDGDWCDLGLGSCRSVR